MTAPMPDSRFRSPPRLRSDVVLAIAALAVQAIAAAFFVIDGIDDAIAQFRQGPDFELMMELLVALALLLSVALATRQLRLSLERSRRQDEALAVARGAIAGLLERRFGEWRLSPAEADVALFALKGATITEIAAMRNAAEGTVRSQLSQVYAKAGVTSQSMLISQFIEELV